MSGVMFEESYQLYKEWMKIIDLGWKLLDEQRLGSITNGEVKERLSTFAEEQEQRMIAAGHKEPLMIYETQKLIKNLRI